jgi:probable phosphoglycerate mutase
MQELSDRVHGALAACLELPQGSRPLLVSHGIALGCLVSTILGLPAYAERRLRLRNCSISRVDYQESLWLAPGWVVETAGDISHLDAPALDELQR